MSVMTKGMDFVRVVQGSIRTKPVVIIVWHAAGALARL